MSNISEEEEEDSAHHSLKRDSIEESDPEPVMNSSVSRSSQHPKPVEGRIPKRQKKLPQEEEDDPVVVQARKALEMFKEIEASEDTIPVGGGDTISTKENIFQDKIETKITTLGSPGGPKIHHRIPIISQQEELLL